MDAVDPDQITVLIGVDAAEAHLQQEYRRGGEGQPLAIKTGLGWTLFGTARQRDRAVHTAACYHMSSNIKSSLPSLWSEDSVRPSVHVNQLRVSRRIEADQQLDQFLPKFWEQEHLGILPQKEVAMSIEDVKALEKFRTPPKNVGKRFCYVSGHRGCERFCVP